MRLAFMGTPAFAVPSLAELVASGHEVVAVYSQPPKPRGRGMKLTPARSGICRDAGSAGVHAGFDEGGRGH